MQFNHSKLLGKFKEKGYTQATISQHIGISKGTLNAKLNNKNSFTTDEMASICKLLSIPACEIGEYFFTQKV